MLTEQLLPATPRDRRLALLAVAEAPELPQGVNEFDMGNWWRRDGCGTAACLAGCYAAAYPLSEVGIMLRPPLPLTTLILPRLASYFGLDDSSVFLAHGGKSHAYSRYHTTLDTREAVAQRLRNVMTKLGDFDGA